MGGYVNVRMYFYVWVRCLKQSLCRNITTLIYNCISDELQKWRSRLKESQTRSVARYVKNKNEEENTNFQKLAEIYIDLRMHEQSENYQRLETRTHYDNLQLERDINTCSQIKVENLFKAERQDTSTPVRSLVI